MAYNDVIILSIVTIYVIIRKPNWQGIKSQYGLKFLCQVTRFLPLCILWMTWITFYIIDPLIRKHYYP